MEVFFSRVGTFRDFGARARIEPRSRLRRAVERRDLNA
jgi:hypothetical protein